MKVNITKIKELERLKRDTEGELETARMVNARQSFRRE